MTVMSETFTVATHGRGTHEITAHLQDVVRASGIANGLCNVFVHHTSASLIICENADPSVLHDLETWLGGAVEDGDDRFTHTMEGADDMSAHVRSVLTQSSIGIPIANGRCDLGTWQGVYVFEHRMSPHRRRVTVTVVD